MRSRLAFAALLSTLLLGGVALAAIPSSDGRITLCYDKSTHKVSRLIDPNAGERCRPDERSVSWSAQQGGSATGYEVVTRDVAYPPEGANDLKRTTETLTCPVGKRATEAGVRNLRPADGTPTEVNGERVFEATWKPIEPLVSSEQPGNVYGSRLGPTGRPTAAPGGW
jgi:hypothetical protein